MTQKPKHNRVGGLRSAATGGTRLRLPGSAIRSGRAIPGWILRLSLLLVLGWALTGAMGKPSDLTPAFASGRPVDASVPNRPRAVPAGQYFPETGFSVQNGPIGDYFRARGGVRAFGPPISNELTLLGAPTQFFRDFLLRQNPDGSVSTLDLFGMGAIPGLQIGGRTLPDVDPSVTGAAPSPDLPGYATQVQAFVAARVPNQWEGMAVGFLARYQGTVTFEDAFPGGAGDRGLLPGMALEVWGLPVSQPVRDPGTPDIVYLRWQRGIMTYDARTGVVETLPLGQVFKAVVTGQNLPPDLEAAARQSPFYRQFDPNAPGSVARPAALADTNLADAFLPDGTTAAAVAQQQSPPPWWELTPTVTPNGYQPPAPPPPYTFPGGNAGYPTPTMTPYGYQAPPGYAGFQTPTATPYGYQAGYPTPNTGFPVGAATTGTPGSDPCYGDEQMTYVPETPRVGNDLIVAISSARPHPYGRLMGTERAEKLGDRPGQLGWVQEWKIVPSYPGDHEYTFYVDSTIPCKKIQLKVEKALATRTPTPTKTPKPYYYNGNSNGNDNSNSNGNANNNSNFTSGTADVYASWTSGPSSLARNATADYTVTVGNNGPETADSITATGFISGSGADIVNASLNGNGCSISGVQFSCTMGQIGQGNSVPLVFTIRATGGSSPSFSATVSVSSSRGDSNWSNNYAYSPTITIAGANPVDTPTAVAIVQPTATTGPFNPVAYIGQGDRYNCVDFQSQADAQAVLRADVSDPNRLDTSNPQSATTPDGIACATSYEAPEWASWFYYPEPHDMTPVATRIPAPTKAPLSPDATPHTTPGVAQP
ncbi:MAG: hypothetical protein IT305_17215 [Chloroflexi bacterium]|nr:hypothetical protein [Chloroflexota bacterium]